MKMCLEHATSMEWQCLSVYVCVLVWEYPVLCVETPWSPFPIINARFRISKFHFHTSCTSANFYGHRLLDLNSPWSTSNLEMCVGLMGIWRHEIAPSCSPAFPTISAKTACWHGSSMNFSEMCVWGEGWWVLVATWWLWLYMYEAHFECQMTLIES